MGFQQFRELHPNVKLRLLMQFFGGVAHSMVLPLMSIYFAAKIGQSVTGVMLMFIFLGGAVGTMVGGSYADRFGRKKVMIVSEAVVVGSYLLITAFNSPFLDAPYLTFGAFVINVLFGSMFGPASQAMLIDVTAPANRKFVFTLTYWINNLAIGIGVMVGARLFERHLFELFLALTAVTLTSLLVTVFLLTETYFPKKATVEREPVSSEPPASSQKNNIFKEMLDVLKDKVFAIYILASTLGLSLEFLFGEYGGIRLHNEMETQPLLTGLPWFGDVSGVEMFGNLKMENTFLVVLIAPLIALLTRRLSNRSSLLGGLVLYAAGFAVLGVSTTPWVLLLAMLVVTIGELMHIPVKQAFLGDLAPEDRRSSYLAVNGISFVGSMQIAAIGVFVGGFLSSWVMSVCFVGVGLISVVLFGRILPELERRQSGVTDAPAVVKMEEIGPSV